MEQKKKSIELNFIGPYGFENIVKDLIHDGKEIEGIYLWAIKQSNSNRYLIHYIGESTKIIKRQQEHLIEILGLNYGIFNPLELSKGKIELVWDGLWRKRHSDRIGDVLRVYPDIKNSVIEYIKSINIFLAKTTVDTNERRHIEGILGNHLRTKRKEFKSIYPDDNRVILRKNMGDYEISIHSESEIMGLDTNIPHEEA